MPMLRVFRLLSAIYYERLKRYITIHFRNFLSLVELGQKKKKVPLFAAPLSDVVPHINLYSPLLTVLIPFCICLYPIIILKVDLKSAQAHFPEIPIYQQFPWLARLSNAIATSELRLLRCDDFMAVPVLKRFEGQGNGSFFLCYLF